MARNYNQDYFKVGGTEVEDRDQSRFAKAQLTHQAAMLRKAAARPPPPPKPKARKAAPAASQAAKPPTTGRMTAQVRPITSARAATEKRQQPVATVHEIHKAKPVHGKKRRSSKKRHEVEVLHEMQEHPELSPAESGRVARTGEPVAPVINVRQAADAKAARGMPNVSPLEAQRGVFARISSAYETGKHAVEFVKDLVTAPITLVRVLRDLAKEGV